MKIRKKSTIFYEACCNTGDVTTLYTWLSTRATFSSMEVFKDGSVKVKLVDSTTISLNLNDYIREDSSGLLDRITAENFSSTWEIVPS